MTKKRKKKLPDQSPHQTPESAGGTNLREDTIRRVFLILAAFCAGGAVMIVELAGNRILAPWFGNSLYTWTGLIGVILISLSCGYYLGGYLADKRPEYAILAHLLAASAFLTMLVPVFQSPVAGWISPLNIVWGPVLATTLLFALPGCLLATVSPFAIRLISLLSEDKNIGISAGCIGMCSTLGSVVGTFAAGFVLIPHAGLKTIFLVTGLVLAVLAVSGYALFPSKLGENKTPALASLVMLGVAAAVAISFSEDRSPAVIFDETTFYHRIRVIEKHLDNGDRLRTLGLDTTIEGSQFVTSRELPGGYQPYWRLAEVFCPHLKRAAFLGGGAFGMPEALLDAFPQAHADVVEIDPRVIYVGRKYFRVDEYEYPKMDPPRMNAVAGDARRFLHSTDAQYDLIFGDAYHGVKCIPAHLTTREFFELVKRRLSDRGVYIMNISSKVHGQDSIVFQSVAKTLSKVFEFHCIFITNPGKPEGEQNIFIVAAWHDLDVDAVLARRYDDGGRTEKLLAGYLAPGQYDLSDGIVLTDDKNPVEYLVARTLKSLVSK